MSVLTQHLIQLLTEGEAARDGMQVSVSPLAHVAIV